MTSSPEKNSAGPHAPLFRNLARRKAYEEVADEIRKLIFEQNLPPAHRLPTERELAVQFGVGRTAVREAIRTLERGGLLQVKKGAKGGLFVAQDYDRPINDSIVNLLAGGGASLDDLFEMRLLIEPYAAARAVERAREEDLAELDDMLRQAEAERRAGHSLRRPNLAFHEHVLRLSGNSVLCVVGEAVLRILADRIQALVSPSTSEKALAMHKLIVAAMRKRQPRRASALMARDIEATGKRLARVSSTTLLRLARDPAIDRGSAATQSN